jgi:hypothetical protein
MLELVLKEMKEVKLLPVLISLSIDFNSFTDSYFTMEDAGQTIY